MTKPADLRTGRGTLAARWRPILKTDVVRYAIKEDLRPSLQARYAGELFDGSFWYEVDVTPEWRVAFRMHPDRSSFVIAEVRIFPLEKREAHDAPGEWSGTTIGPRARVPSGGIPAGVTKALRSATVRLAALRMAANLRAAAPKLSAKLAEGGLLPVERKAGRPRQTSTRFLISFAKRYAKFEERNAGTGQSTIRDLAKHYGVPASKISSSWLRTARKLGYLSPRAKGQRGSVYEGPA